MDIDPDDDPSRALPVHEDDLAYYQRVGDRGMVEMLRRQIRLERRAVAKTCAIKRNAPHRIRGH